MKKELQFDKEYALKVFEQLVSVDSTTGKCDDIEKLVVPYQDIIVGTDDSDAPCSAWHWLIAHQRGIAIDDHRHISPIALCHLVAKGNEVGLLSRVDIAEDGLVEQPRGVRMNEEASLFVDHHEIGVRVGLYLRHGLRQT